VSDRKNFEREIQEISEREQRRLGQDLHDSLGQSLTGIAFLAKALQQNLQSKKLPQAPDAGNIATLLNEALTQARRMSRGLCPMVLETNDIETALEELVENFKSLFSVACELRCEPGIKIANTDVAVHLYRIAQEAATNAIKHGKAKKIYVSLSRIGSKLVLRVKNDGLRFPKELPKGKGIGFRVMHYRARMIGGVLTARPLRGGGVLLTCSLPAASAAKGGRDDGEKPLTSQAPSIHQILPPTPRLAM